MKALFRARPSRYLTGQRVVLDIKLLTSGGAKFLYARRWSWYDSPTCPRKNSPTLAHLDPFLKQRPFPFEHADGHKAHPLNPTSRRITPQHARQAQHL